MSLNRGIAIGTHRFSLSSITEPIHDHHSPVPYPVIIQGGMGIAVSNWALARTVSKLGQLGVVSGTALAVVLARRLQLGDPCGSLRRALASFPFPEMAQRILATYFIAEGKPAGSSYRSVAMPALKSERELVELTVAANFVEVFLAKDGHSGPVGINYLEKIQFPTLPSIFGAMLAGVDYILMGAGIPRAIPGVLDRMAAGAPTELRMDVTGAAPEESFFARFDPREFCGGAPPRMKRPLFLGIISSAVLALTLAKKASGQVDGFVVEGSTAGGHNAPPRGELQLSAEGEPIYGSRDTVDLSKIRDLGLPFWLAGSYGRPGRLAEALALGATGVQVGTAFAFCDESGLTPDIKRRAIALSRQGDARVFTDPRLSPTGFPFKIAQLTGTLAEPAVRECRRCACDLGFLREAYRNGDDALGYRCAAESVDAYLRKGGQISETEGRGCLCNALMAAVGLGQVRGQAQEPPLVTAGDDFSSIGEFCTPGRDGYAAADVVKRLLG